LKHSYTFSFDPLVTVRFDGLFMERVMVISKEMEHNKFAISTSLDLSFTVEDIHSLATENLYIYFKKNKQELKKRISFYDWENYSKLTNEEAEECIIDSIFQSDKMKQIFWKIANMFYELREAEKAIVNNSYDVEVIHKHELEIEAAGEIFVLELEGEGKETTVRFFAYYVDERSDLIPISNFLAKEVEEIFFKNVLKKNKNSTVSSAFGRRLICIKELTLLHTILNPLVRNFLAGTFHGYFYE